MSFSSEAVCGSCWQAYSYGAWGEIREPRRMRAEARTQEVCCFCAGDANEGIYLRVETEKVPFSCFTKPMQAALWASVDKGKEQPAYSDLVTVEDLIAAKESCEPEAEGRSSP